MTTVHAYNSSQQMVDGASGDFRRGRAGAANLIPATTGAALAATRALPDLAGLFDGVALRAPVPVGSIADITLVAARPTDGHEVNRISRARRLTATATAASWASSKNRSSPRTSWETRGLRSWTRP